jgi:DNA-binding NarL/FixJ family response regulator
MARAGKGAGLADDAIARRLEVSQSTAHRHVAAIL